MFNYFISCFSCSLQLYAPLNIPELTGRQNLLQATVACCVCYCKTCPLLLSVEDFLCLWLGKKSVAQYLKHILQDRYFVAQKCFKISRCLEFNHATRSRLMGNPVPSCGKEQAGVFRGLLNPTSGSYGVHLPAKPSTSCVRVLGSGKLLLFCYFLLSHLCTGSQRLSVSPPALPPAPCCVCCATRKSEAAIALLVGLGNLVTSYSAARGVSKRVVKQQRNELFPKCSRNGFLWNLLLFILIYDCCDICPGRGF